LADLVADGLPTQVVTHHLQVEHMTRKVRRSQPDVLPLCHATNYGGLPSSQTEALSLKVAHG